MIRLLKAFRVNENTVKVLYFHDELHYEFVVEWNNIDEGTGEIIDYYLVLGCLSSNENFSNRVVEAIENGENESGEDETIDLYLALRDTFSSSDCEDI